MLSAQLNRVIHGALSSLQGPKRRAASSLLSCFALGTHLKVVCPPKVACHPDKGEDTEGLGMLCVIPESWPERTLHHQSEQKLLRLSAEALYLLPSQGFQGGLCSAPIQCKTCLAPLKTQHTWCEWHGLTKKGETGIVTFSCGHMGSAVKCATAWQHLDQAPGACSMTLTAGLAAKVTSRIYAAANGQQGH